MKYHNVESIFDEMLDNIKYIKISTKFCHLSTISKK